MRALLANMDSMELTHRRVVVNVYHMGDDEQSLEVLQEEVEKDQLPKKRLIKALVVLRDKRSWKGHAYKVIDRFERYIKNRNLMHLKCSNLEK